VFSGICHQATSFNCHFQQLASNTSAEAEYRSGFLELKFKSVKVAETAVSELRSVRSDLMIRCLEDGETVGQIMNSVNFEVVDPEQHSTDLQL